jgi:hypothetical protein
VFLGDAPESQHRLFSTYVPEIPMAKATVSFVLMLLIVIDFVAEFGDRRPATGIAFISEQRD